MSLHFSGGNQYTQEYDPRRLRNWQVPKWYPEAPLPRKGRTVVVSNDRGHLLPGIPRSKDDPWGNYVGTWDLPRKIDRQTATKLSAPNKTHVESYKKRVERYLRQKETKPLTKSKPQQDEKATEVVEDVKQEATEEKVCPCCGQCPCVKTVKVEAAEEDTVKPDEEETKVEEQTTPKACPIHDY